MPESTASPPGPSKGGMQQIGCVPDMNRHTTQWQHTSDCMQTEEEKTSIPQKYAGHEGNDGHNVLSTEVIVFKGTPFENALRISALTPLTIEHGMVNDELMYWFFAYYHTYGPQNAFEECFIANSFMWQHLNSHVSEHGPTENSLKAFVEEDWQRDIPKGTYNGNEVDDSILDKWIQPNVPTQTGSWECDWFVLKYFDMYIQQRFVATEMEFERVQFTEAWFAYDDAIAMRAWLEEAIRTELFGPTFENSGPWQLMKSSRRGWIAPQYKLKSQEQQILANDIASFKATSESPGHQEVIKRVCNHFVGIAHEAMEEMMESDPQKNVKEMWIGGHLVTEKH
ncbi:unnamed protein product [Sphagnum tenellum]